MSLPTTNIISGKPSEIGGKALLRLTAKARAWCLAGVLLAGFILLAARFFVPYVSTHPNFFQYFMRPCQFRAQTNVPCPLCGATRSTVHAAHGRLMASLQLSPLGLPVVALSAVAIIWLGWGAASGRDWGLRATWRAARRIRAVHILLVCVTALALLWVCKIIMDCVLGWH
jgi:hypothetical protein